MISGEKIASHIARPALTAEADLSDIAELIKKYPYCGSLYLLHIKGLALTNDLDFEQQLKRVASHAHDREHLYNLIHSADNLRTTHPVTESEPFVQVEKEPEVIIPVENETVTPIKPEAETALQNSVELEQNSISTELIPEIFNAVMDADFVLSEIEGMPLRENQPNAVKEDAIEHAEPAVEVEIDLENLSFSQWLRMKQQGGIPNAKTDLPIEQKPHEKPETKITVDALLEKFIREEPRISKPVTDFFSPAKNARQSIEEQDDLVTETLAEIYVLQKNFQKAISAYEKLILLYPEKKTFFASRIEKIRAEIKNK